MYNDILFSGARRFMVCNVDSTTGRLAETGVVFYLDTDFQSEQNRFTSVDVLEVTRGTLPDGWSEVHSLDYPKDVFGLNQITYSPEGKPVAWAGDRARWSSWPTAPIKSTTWCRGG